MNFIMYGKIGSGKGTQAKELAKRCGYAHISTGDMLRDAELRKTAAGAKITELIDAGEFIPDAQIFHLLVERLKRLDCARGWVLDGFPRTLPQLALMIHSDLFRVHGMIELVVSSDTVVKRISRRLFHEPSGRSYHPDFVPPRVSGKDDVTGEDLIQRADDTETAVLARLAIYRAKTQPVLETCKMLARTLSPSDCRYFEVDGEEDPVTLYRTIYDYVDQLNEREVQPLPFANVRSSFPLV
jgi:adenylate kinase